MPPLCLEPSEKDSQDSVMFQKGVFPKLLLTTYTQKILILFQEK